MRQENAAMGAEDAARAAVRVGWGVADAPGEMWISNSWIRPGTREKVEKLAREAERIGIAARYF